MISLINRKAFVEAIQWMDEDGRCTVGHAMSIYNARPSEQLPDLKSIVTLIGPPEKYTDEELAKLLEFSQQKTAEHDKVCPWRLGSNFYVFNKKLDTERPLPWMRRRWTWDSGPMWSETLDEALAVMANN